MLTSGQNILANILATTFLIASFQAKSQELYPVKLSDRLWHDEQLELRYKPEGTDFVITNGNRLFTRALYGTHTGFRVETGDRPEFALYMPGMGGNLKFGIATSDSSKWLTAAKTITARYRAGSRLYTIQDPMLGTGKLLLEVLAMSDADGFIIKARLQDVKTPVTLYWAFGGATGKKFSRDGDMGPDPESSFYLKPEGCKDNQYTISNANFTLKYGSGLEIGQDGRYFVEELKKPSQLSKEQTLVGTFPIEAVLKISDATQLSTPQSFYNSQVDKATALGGKISLASNTDYYFSIHNPATKPTFSYTDLPKQFTQAEATRKELAERITIHTPDPYINLIGGTLAVASDAIWEKPVYLHGSIGFRDLHLNGWRGAYTADALGWHDRARTHLESYSKSQVTTPASGLVIADTATHLARSLEKLGIGMFTSGYISRNPDGKSLAAGHYDMNLVFIDILLRHYAWTGDTAFLRKSWPVIKRHLDWETRNFDADGDGLYDAYAAIWASDALQYSGGGVAHSSAYNYYAYKKAATLATILGEDPTPYQNEADKILKAMNKVLWMKDKGSFAEYKDALGNRLLHPAAALWTIYHSMDSETMDPFQAYQSMRYIDNEIPHIPLRAKGLADSGYYTLATTTWMPYMWSLNNVVLAESLHTSLANWQAGRTDEAFKLFKSEIIQSMCLGGSPGNFVQISRHDAVRKEAYRDFGDPIGVFSRALVEGLFGIVPDALNKTFTVRPGLPTTWNYASFSTPDIAFDFKRTGPTDTYTLTPKFSQNLSLKFQTIAKGQVQQIKINGKAVSWKNIDSAVGKPVIEIVALAASKYVISITWQGTKPILPTAEKTYTIGSVINESVKGATVLKVFDPQNALTNTTIKGSDFSSHIIADTGNYTVFLQLRQGQLSWWMPVCFKVTNAITLLAAADPEQNSKSFRLQNNTTNTINAFVTVNGFNTTLNIPAGKQSTEVVIPEKDLITGTNNIAIKLTNNNTITEHLYNWQAATKGKLEIVDITSYFNDKVIQIFKNKYLTPRPQVNTLQLPWQGIGDWPHYAETHEINDSGLRKLAGDKNTITIPQGISFFTPGTIGTNNILFTSQWDNYPKEKTIPLSGNASHAWLLMAGSTNPMQSQLDNGVVVVECIDGTNDSLLLHNPETWWPIDQDYFTDGFAFALKRPRPIRVHLKTGTIVSGEESKASYNGKAIEGGAATVLDMPLNATKTLKNITLKTVANDVVTGLMSVTLLR